MLKSLTPRVWFIIGGIILLILIVALYVSANNRQLALSPSPSPIPSAGTPLPSPSTSAQAIPNTMQLYVNQKDGYRLTIPKTAYNATSCAQVIDNGSPKYTYTYGQVAVNTFEDSDFTAIDYEYTFPLGSPCQKVTTSLATIKNEIQAGGKTWVITVASVANDAALDQFIKKQYGNGCSVGDKYASNQAGVFDVAIKGDGKNLGESECPVNYVTVIKYYPAKKKVAQWDLGQGITFAAEDLTSKRDAIAYDSDMADSFLFD